MSLHSVIKCNGCPNKEEFPAGENISHILSKYGWWTGAISKWNGERLDFCPDCVESGRASRDTNGKKP